MATTFDTRSDTIKTHDETQDNYLLSFRDTSEVDKNDGKTGI